MIFSLLNCLVLMLDLYMQMLFSLFKDYFDTDIALKVSHSLYCFTSSISHGVENYFLRMWGMGIFDAIFSLFKHILICQNKMFMYYVCTI